MPTTYSNLLPTNVADTVINRVREDSAVMRAANVRRMAAGQTSLPVRSVQPTASFVAGVGGRKPTATLEWDRELLVPEEVALVVPVPHLFVEDSDFDIDGEIEDALVTAIVRAIDAAVLFGTGAPASFGASLLARAGTPLQPAAAGNIAEAMSDAFAQVEAAGVFPTDVLAGARLTGALRRYASIDGAMVDPSEAFGVDVTKVANWAADPVADGIVGDFSHLLLGIRNDIRIVKSDSGVLTDGAGVVTYSAFEDNVTLYKAYMRVGVAVASTVDGSVPFASVEVTNAA